MMKLQTPANCIHRQGVAASMATSPTREMRVGTMKNWMEKWKVEYKFKRK